MGLVVGAFEIVGDECLGIGSGYRESAPVNAAFVLGIGPRFREKLQRCIVAIDHQPGDVG